MKKQEMRRLLALVGQLTRGQRRELVDKLQDAVQRRGFHRSAGVGWQRGPGLPALQERGARAQRHAGDDHAILAARHELYVQARERKPARWSHDTRNWKRRSAAGWYCWCWWSWSLLLRGSGCGCNRCPSARAGEARRKGERRGGCSPGLHEAQRRLGIPRRAGFSLHPCVAPGTASLRAVAARADGAAVGLGGRDPDRRPRTRRGLVPLGRGVAAAAGLLCASGGGTGGRDQARGARA